MPMLLRGRWAVVGRGAGRLRPEASFRWSSPERCRTASEGCGLVRHLRLAALLQQPELVAPSRDHRRTPAQTAFSQRLQAQTVARVTSLSHEARRCPSFARGGAAARASHDVRGPEPPRLRYWRHRGRGGRGDEGQRLLAAGPALRLRRARAVHRRGDDEVPPRQAPRDLRRGHQRQARREGPAPYC